MASAQRQPIDGSLEFVRLLEERAAASKEGPNAIYNDNPEADMGGHKGTRKPGKKSYAEVELQKRIQQVFGISEANSARPKTTLSHRKDASLKQGGLKEPRYSLNNDSVVIIDNEATHPTNVSYQHIAGMKNQLQTSHN